MGDFILIHESDNVVTALTSLEPGHVLRLKGSGGFREITVRESIPFAHKCAIVDIREGGQVLKYGETIGLASQDIGSGEHVHVHNLRSIRGTVRGKRDGNQVLGISEA
jgi:altronate dehydratase small subunit